jgi:DNA-binding PadR family transcriptional regulator
VLKKLEGQGMIKSYWKVQAGERPRKYYTIQNEGINQLKSNQEDWNMVQSVFGKLWNFDL